MSTIIDGSAGITFPNSTTQASAGQVLQVVTTTYSTQTTNNTNVYADTGLTATITPKFSTSKILVMITHAQCYKSSDNASNDFGLNLCRNGSQIIEITSYLGYTGGAAAGYFCASFNYSDSPATTSAITYKTQFKNSDNNGAAVRAQAGSTPSTIVLMEIAA